MFTQFYRSVSKGYWIEFQFLSYCIFPLVYWASEKRWPAHRLLSNHLKDSVLGLLQCLKKLLKIAWNFSFTIDQWNYIYTFFSKIRKPFFCSNLSFLNKTVFVNRNLDRNFLKISLNFYLFIFFNSLIN